MNWTFEELLIRRANIDYSQFKAHAGLTLGEEKILSAVRIHGTLMEPDEKGVWRIEEVFYTGDGAAGPIMSRLNSVLKVIYPIREIKSRTEYMQVSKYVDEKYASRKFVSVPEYRFYELELLVELGPPGTAGYYCDIRNRLYTSSQYSFYRIMVDPGKNGDLKNELLKVWTVDNQEQIIGALQRKGLLDKSKRYVIALVWSRFVTDLYEVIKEVKLPPAQDPYPRSIRVKPKSIIRALQPRQVLLTRVYFDNEEYIAVVDSLEAKEGFYRAAVKETRVAGYATREEAMLGLLVEVYLVEKRTWRWRENLARYIRPDINLLRAAIFVENDVLKINALKDIYNLLYG